MKTLDGTLTVISGASRSGKTVFVKNSVKSKKRILVWDPEAQWCEIKGFKKITEKKQLIEQVQKTGAYKVAFVAGGDIKTEFDFFCGCAMFAGRYVAPVDVIAEELADVTAQGKAPNKWGILLRRGLKRGINIWAISQRWAEADKTAIGNASQFVLFRASPEDARYLERKTGVAKEKVNELVQLEYIVKNAITGEEKPKQTIKF